MYGVVVFLLFLYLYFFFFKQKTAYEMRISDWSSDVCSSDLGGRDWFQPVFKAGVAGVRRAALVGAGRAHQEGLRALADRGGRPAPAHAAGVAVVAAVAPPLHLVVEIGRASCRERVCQYV